MSSVEDEESLEDDELVLEVASVDEVLDDALSDEDAPPGPPEKVLANTCFSSVAWSLVSLPSETSLSIRLSIFDCASSGGGGAPPPAPPAFIAESISSSADDSALWSLELIVPEETSLASSAFNRLSGELALLDAAEIVVMLCSLHSTTIALLQGG